MSFDNGYLSHTDDILSANHGNPFKSTKGRLISHLLATGVVGSMLYLEYSYVIEKISLTLNTRLYLGLNCFAVLMFLVLEYWKSSAFSGLPYLNDDKKKRSKAIKTTILVFLFGKLVDCGISVFLILRSFTDAIDFEEWISGAGYKGYILYASMSFLILLCELWPITKSMDESYLDILQKDGDHHNIQLIVENSTKVQTFFRTTMSQKSNTNSLPEQQYSPTKDGTFMLATIKNIQIDMLNINVVFLSY